MKNSTPSLVDVLLTNKPRYCCNAINFGCGVSDWYNLIGVMIKGTAARVEKRRCNIGASRVLKKSVSVRMSVRFHLMWHMFLMTLTIFTGHT